MHSTHRPPQAEPRSPANAPPDDRPPPGTDILAHLLGDAAASSPRVTELARSAAALADGCGADAGGPGAAAVLADDLVVLARVRHLLDAHTGRVAAAADRVGATATGVRSTLAAQGWTVSSAAALLRAGRFAELHPRLHDLWRLGRVSTSGIAALAHGTHSLDADQTTRVVHWLLPLLPGLDVPRIRTAVEAAVDLLRPEDAKQRERFDHDRRHLLASRLHGMVLIEARLPQLEGEAFLAAIRAFAEKLRTDDDGLTTGQRQADALAALVAAATASGGVPAAGGLPAAATVTISLTEAEQLLGGSERFGDAERQDETGGSGPPDPEPPGDLGPADQAAPPDPATLPARIAGGTTIGAAAARFVLCAGEITPVLAHTPRGPLAELLGTTPCQPLAVGRAQRLANAAQRKALALRDRGCIIPGCHIPPDQCQPHHVTDWARSGRTDLENMALLCWPHHRQVELHQWLIGRGSSADGPRWNVVQTPRSTWRPRR